MTLRSLLQTKQRATLQQAELSLVRDLLAERDAEIRQLLIELGVWQKRFGDAEATIARLEEALDRYVKNQGNPL